MLLETTRRQAQELGGLVAHHASDGLRDDVDGLVETVTARIDHTRELYDRSDTGIIEILVAALDTNYAGQTRDAREIKRAHEDALSDRGAERIDGLVHSLEEIDVARQYLKTLYIQNELAEFSRKLLYVGVPAMFVSVCVLSVFTTYSNVGMTDPALRAVVVGAIVVGLMPLAVLLSFVLRVATVSQKTIAITPFTMAQQESEDRQGA